MIDFRVKQLELNIKTESKEMLKKNLFTSSEGHWEQVLQEIPRHSQIQ